MLKVFSFATAALFASFPLLASETRQAALVRQYYCNALDFTQNYGAAFCRFVLKPALAKEDCRILVALGGAEHLGTVLEKYLERNRLRNFQVHYAHLTTKIVGPWKLKKEIGGIRSTWVGYGSPPPGAEVVTYDPSSPAELEEYLRQQGALDGDALVVVDSGFSGSIAEAVARIARTARYPGSISARLLKFAGATQVKGHSIPIAGFNEFPPEDVKMSEFRQAIERWAWMFEEGSACKWFSADEYAFQRSRRSATHLVREENGKLGPNTQAYTDAESLAKYRATVQGIEDGFLPASARAGH